MAHPPEKENTMNYTATSSLPHQLPTVEETWTGHISDSICGAAHHRKIPGTHTKMSARECTLASVKDGAEFVFVSLGNIYKIANRDLPAVSEHAGHTVNLTGVKTGDTIHVSEIVMPLDAGSKVAVFGIFYDKERAVSCVERLTASDFSKDEVSILEPNLLGTKDLAHDRHSKAGNSTAVVTSSVAVGGAVGLAAGIGLLAIPGVGLLAAAPMLGALAGMGVGGAVGGAIDAIDAAGPPDLAAKRYEGHIDEGGILVTVHCYNAAEINRAKDGLAKAGARAISSSDEPAAEFQADADAGIRQ